MILVLLKMVPDPEVRTERADLAARVSPASPGSWAPAVDARDTPGQMPSGITGQRYGPTACVPDVGGIGVRPEQQA